nr:hypothetical protein CFP56_16725 [Quercus suber]
MAAYSQQHVGRLMRQPLDLDNVVNANRLLRSMNVRDEVHMRGPINAFGFTVFTAISSIPSRHLSYHCSAASVPLEAMLSRLDGLIIGLIGLGLCNAQLTTELREMKLWGQEDGGEWITKPTWHQSFMWDPSIGPSARPGYLAGLTLANAYFNWVQTQPHARSGGNALVLTNFFQVPSDSFFAIWGSFEEEDTIGAERSPCKNKRSDENQHGCQTTADNLGISWRPYLRTKYLPYSANHHNVPLPVPPTLPVVQPDDAEPWDQDPVTNADLLGAENSKQRKRFAKESKEYDAAPEQCATTDDFSESQAQGQVLVPRETNSSEAGAASDIYATTTWPVTLTGTSSYPTPADVVTTFDPLIASLTASYHSTSATASSVSCEYQDATPENPAACTCVSGASTTVVQPMRLSSVSVITQACAYSTWPAGVATVTSATATVTTNFPVLSGCQVCTVVGPNEDECSPLPSSLGCTVAKTTTILSADTSGVQVGTLTGAALSSAITSAIDQVCEIPPGSGQPTGTYSCIETATATLATDVLHTEISGAQTLWSTNAELTLQITEANYDSLEWYASSKAIIAAFAQNSTQISGDEQNPTDPTSFIPTEISQTMTICKVGSNFQLIEVDPISGAATRELSFSLRYKDEATGSILCQFLEDVIEFIEATVNIITDTEEAIPEELVVDQELLDSCEKYTSSS